MKRKYFITMAITLFILTGCSNTTTPTVINDTSAFVPSSTEESSSSYDLMEESIPSSVKDDLVCLDQKILENNNSCQSISIIQQGTEQPQLLIKATDNEEFSFTPPKLHYPKYLDELYFTDLNEDGTDEVIAVCFLTGGNIGIYIIDIANQTFLTPPYINETDATVGIEYNVYSVDDNHVQIKGESFDEIIDLSLDEIWNWNYDTNLSEEEYFQLYQGKGPIIGSSDGVGYNSIEVVNYNNRNCLKLREQLCCPWYWYGHLGYMETIVSWDKNGEFHIENMEYLKHPLYIDRIVFESNSPCQSISIIKEGIKQPKLFIKVTDNEEFYFDPPELHYPMSFNQVSFTDLNGDGVDEAVVECFLGGSFPGIYILDIVNHSYLTPPYAANMDYIQYTIYAVDENHIQIKGEIFDSIIELTSDENWSWNTYPNMTKEEYIRPYQETGRVIGGTSSASHFGIELVTYNNRNCLKFIQVLRGPWSTSDYLGCMETIVSWNKNGEFNIENAEYLKTLPW